MNSSSCLQKNKEGVPKLSLPLASNSLPKNFDLVYVIAPNSQKPTLLLARDV